jgi:5-methylcytosine-specific restriction endonuclease McrA
MEKICSYCKVSLSLDYFSRHPTAKHGRKHICRKCDKEYSKKRYSKICAEKNIKPKPKLSAFVTESKVKNGDVREDGSVFWSKRKVKGGFREWWVTPEQFEKLIARRRELERTRYHSIPAIRAKNTSPEKKKARLKWKEKNRSYYSSFHAQRRAQIRGTRSNLTEEQKRLVYDIYRFRDVLNAVHEKLVFEVDHIKPICRGGTHTPDNLRVTTKNFNRKKWASDPIDVIRYAAVASIYFCDENLMKAKTIKQGGY